MISDVTNSLLPFLAILNPFALCLYLVGVMEDLEYRELLKVLVISSLTSLAVFWLFVIFGNSLLRVVGVSPPSLRIFGGIIFFVVAYNYVTKGFKGAEVLRGSLDELPSAIALPYMIGAGTITQSIIIGDNLPGWLGMMVVAVAVATTFLAILIFKRLRDMMRGAREPVFDRWVNILSRINGLVIGAVSTEMVIAGIHNLWEKV